MTSGNTAAGDMSVFEEAKADSFKNERNAGNYGDGTKELQAKNYAKAKEVRYTSFRRPASTSLTRRIPRARRPRGCPVYE